MATQDHGPQVRERVMDCLLTGPPNKRMQLSDPP